MARIRSDPSGQRAQIVILATWGGYTGPARDQAGAAYDEDVLVWQRKVGVVGVILVSALLRAPGHDRKIVIMGERAELNVAGCPTMEHGQGTVVGSYSAINVHAGWPDRRGQR